MFEDVTPPPKKSEISWGLSSNYILQNTLPAVFLLVSMKTKASVVVCSETQGLFAHVLLLPVIIVFIIYIFVLLLVILLNIIQMERPVFRHNFVSLL